LIRDRLLASHFGAGPELDAYFAAFRIPDFVFAILMIGGISAAFLPVFSENFKKEDGEQESEWPKPAKDFVNSVLNCFFIATVAICALLAIFAPFIIELIAPGFSSENKSLTVMLTRIMFLSPIFFGISSVFSGVLQYFNRFLVYSIAPLLYNLGIIFGIVFLVPIFGVLGVAFGVIIGACAHFLIQAPAVIKTGFRYELSFDFKNFGLRKLFGLMAPRTIGAAADQINLFFITAIASTLGVGAVAIFNFANNLYYFPIALFGVSFAVSSFPIFSRLLANGQKAEFFKRFSSSFEHIIFFVAPISLLLFIFRAQIIRLVLGAGKFGWEETRLTAACLGIFCIGIIAESLIPLICRAFFAFQDTKTPVIVGVCSIALTLSMNFLFVYLLGFDNLFRQFVSSILKLQDIGGIAVIGLPLAVSADGIIQFFALLFLLAKKTEFDWRGVWVFLKKIIAGSMGAGIAAYAGLYLASQFVDMRTFFGVFIQLVFATICGGGVYFGIGWILKLRQTQIIKDLVFGQFVKRII
jgi:putative peptidoglycan lipid II flippase